MRELYELKEMLCDELKKYGEKGDMTTGSLEVVDKLAHTVKNIGKIIEMYEDENEYSGNYDYMRGDNRSYARDRSGRSYARGRTGYVRRDAMGRYSRATDDMKEQLRDILEEAPEHMKADIQKLINKI